MKDIRSVSRYLLGAYYILAGIYHFIDPAFFRALVPADMPWHSQVVAFIGACQLVLGSLVLMPRFTRPAAWGIIVFLLALFPANVYMALHPDLFPPFSPARLWARVPAQGLLIAWAYLHTRPVPGAAAPARQQV